MPTLEVAIDARQAKDGSIVFDAAVKKISNSAAEADKSATALTRTMGVFGGILGRYFGPAAIVYGAYRGLKAVTAAAVEQERNMMLLSTSLKATGGASGQTMKSLNDLASSMEAQTSINDDVVKSAENVMLMFTRIGGQTFPRAIRAAADLSVKMGSDMVSSALMLGRALDNPEHGLTMLTRVGVMFSDSQRKMIDYFLKTNQVARAQDLILTSLEGKVGGLAAAQGKTLGGSFNQLANAADAFAKALAKPELVQGLKYLVDQLTSVVNLATQLSTGAYNLAKGSGPAAALGKITTADKIQAAMSRLQASGAMSKNQAAQYAYSLTDSGQTPEQILQDLLKTERATAPKPKEPSQFWAMSPTDIAATPHKERGLGFGTILQQMTNDGKHLEEAAKGIGDAFGSAFEKAISGAESLQGVMKGLLQDITMAVIKAAIITPLTNSITSFIMSKGTPVPVAAHAVGGIIDRPTLSLMGERGAEAVLPLSRGDDGQLGVAASGRSAVVNMTVVVKDAESFRRSRKQIMSDVRKGMRG